MRRAFLPCLLTLAACASTTSEPDPGPEVEGRIIFVTSTVQDADFGGLEGADGLCNAEASAAGLSGEFRAWLSTLTLPAADRLDASTEPYVLVDGTPVADDWDDLTDGSLLTNIDLDAAGGVQVGDVWTGTLPDGQPFDRGDCEGFTSGASDILSLCGTTRSAAANWTANQTPRCDTPLHLFCIEQ